MLDPERESIEQLLRAPIEDLAALGLHRPSRRTLEAFLDHLAEHHVISSASAAAYAALHQEMRYGGKAIDTGCTREVTRRLRAEIARFGELPAQTRADVIRHVCAEPAGTTGRFPEPPDLMPASVDQIADMASRRDPTDHLKPRVKLSPDNRVRIFGVGFILWSIAMLFLGYVLSEPLGSMVLEMKYRMMGEAALPADLEDMDRIRSFAAQHPESALAWRIYGDAAAGQEIFNEAIMAYHYALVRHPEDAETLNNLAWLYCTAEDEVYRDVDLGLDYAMKAWTLSQEPHIADTLAEAYFLNGNREKAIELEKRALEMARNERERQFYEEQLKRFQGSATTPD